MIKEERRRKKNLIMYAKGFFAAVVTGLILGAVICGVFVVKDVKIEGNELYDQAVIEQAILDDDYCWNSLYVFLKYRFRPTEEIPFIDSMEITLQSPHKICIHVYEKVMMGYLYIPGIGENAYFDKDGFVVETSSRIIKDVPKIEGITCNEVVLYEKLPINSAKLREILTLTQTLKREELIPDVITYGIPQEPQVSYQKIRVLIGDTDELTRKVERMDKILDKLEGKSGVLHLENWTEETTNIVFDEDL